MKKRITVISILLFVTIILSFIYLHFRQTVKPGDILIKSEKGEMTVSLSDLSLSHVSGSITNKKGETKKIDSEGYALADLPSLTGINDYSEISVHADDEYSAVLTKDELSSGDKAWLIENDDSIRLVVFDDKDSKRDVKNVVRIEIK